MIRKKAVMIVEPLNKDKKANPLVGFLNSPFSIIAVLIVFVIALLIYTRYLINAPKLYSFSGFTEDISIFNGTIYTNYDINYFGDSKIIYKGVNHKLSEFALGYYIKDGDEYIKIAEGTSRTDIEEPAFLKEILSSCDFSFSEVNKDAQYLSLDNMKKIENLVFKITGKTDKSKDFTLEIPLTVEKISK